MGKTYKTKITLNRRLSLFRNLLGKSSKLKIKTKLTLYNLLLKPIWTYGIQIWGSAEKSNIQTIQVFQSKILRLITNAPPYVSNLILHTDLKIPMINKVAKINYKKFHKRLLNHPNPLIANLHTTIISGNPRKRHKRQWPRDFLI